MKHLKTLPFICCLLWAIALMQSCQEDYFPVIEMPENIVDFEKLSDLEKAVYVDAAGVANGGFDRRSASTRTEQFSLKPILCEKDTALLVAQFNEGWRIYNTSTSLPMVLCESPTGKFDMNDPKMPDALKCIIEGSALDACGIKKVHQNQNPAAEWEALVADPDFVIKGKITERTESGPRKSLASGNVPDGEWILLKYIDLGTETKTSPKLTVTKWGQEYPWNTYSKYVLNQAGTGYVLAPAGCTPVAIAQYLYYCNRKDNKPKTTMSTVEPTADGHDFIFSNPGNKIWDEMCIEYDYKNKAGRKEAALLIGYVGRQMYSEYGAMSTSTDLGACFSYLTNIFGCTFQESEINQTAIIKSLDSGYPIIGTAYTNRKTDNTVLDSKKGHTYLIDQSIVKTHHKKYIYGLKRVPPKPGELDPWMSDEIDDQGNIITYAYVSEVLQDDVSLTGIRMNWGWAGSYDSIEYYPYDSTWIAGGYQFNFNHKIFVRK